MKESAQEIRIPLLNPNETEAKVVHLAVKEGQFVSKDSVLCILETTKSTAEITADSDGFVVSLQVSENNLAEAGSLLCYLADSADWKPEPAGADAVKHRDESRDITSKPEGLRISQPAMKFARDAGLDLTLLPKGPMVTTNMVEDLLHQSREANPQTKEIDPHKLVVYGGRRPGQVALRRKHRIYRKN